MQFFFFHLEIIASPEYLSHNFKKVSSCHEYRTRGSNCNYYFSKEFSLSPYSFSCTATKLWNSLPNELKQISVLGIFKRKLKDYLLSTYAWNRLATDVSHGLWPCYALDQVWLFKSHLFCCSYCYVYFIYGEDSVGNKSLRLLQTILRADLTNCLYVLVQK